LASKHVDQHIYRLVSDADKSMVEAAIAQEIPLKRLGTKWDIAMTAVFLATPAASYISGDTVVVDGAAWLYKPPAIPREMVAQLSRSVESKSRSVGIASTTSPATTAARPPFAKL
jgi:2,4-dienoyl-CoA reductase [(3E)-enoyl-CoA-producing], peroxisomal